MSPKNATINEVLETVQAVQTQGLQTEKRLTAVVEVVHNHGEQIREVLETVQAVQTQGRKTDERLTAVVETVQEQGQRMHRLTEVVQTQGHHIREVSTTVHEALEAVHLLSEHMEERFRRVESQMVTKDYLDDKLADLRGDLTLLTRQEDQKLLTLVDLLFGKRLMTKAEREHIMALQPFAVS